MTSAELMLEGVNLMLSGMGFVLFFLFILIYAIRLASIIINKYFPEPQTKPSKPPIPTHSNNDTEHLRPIIAAAIAHHRRQRGLN
ncbi:oxaloacetate decarboxylase subunit gamma [Rodentibacter caecimuris]|uniref:Probable oxaloacetate decarboxylase gamma chain n=1 Tax=Rodentibacter caecimuris TaxID=1796644 RepID=A0ABX3KWJ5_9PAST|nr:oxaloacetate decarboxylase gamma chain [Rodentibacter heylii]